MSSQRRVISETTVRQNLRLRNYKQIKETGKNDGTGGEEIASKILGDVCLYCDGDLINTNHVKKNTKGHDLECENNIDGGDCYCAFQVKSYKDVNGKSQRMMETGIVSGCGSYSGQREASALYDLHYMIVFYDANGYVTRTIMSGPVKPQDVIKKDNKTTCDVKIYNMRVTNYV